MKNIHLIPTDKPTRLYKQMEILLLDTISDISEEDESINQNIYITSNEDIKEGDWIKWGEAIYKANKKYMSPFKKVILTTDVDLIKDGVQAIDDEFLEWVVNNPSCEEVEVERENICARCYCNNPDDCWSAKECSDGKFDKIKYKLIISKEEHKQHLIDMMKGDEELGLYNNNTEIGMHTLTATTTGCNSSRFGKQETIEEAAVNCWAEGTWDHRDDFRDGFIEGAEWQAERMYELMDGYVDDVMGGCNLRAEEWFEQFKKK